MKWLSIRQLLVLFLLPSVTSAAALTPATTPSPIIANLPEWVQYVNAFQPSIAAFVGFAGVIITIGVNGFLARRLETRKYDRERKGVASALLAELEEVLSKIDGYLRVLGPFAQNQSIEVPILKDVDNFGIIYTEVAPKIGLLDHDAVLSVTQVFLRMRSFSKTLIAIKLIKDPNRDEWFYWISDLDRAIDEFNKLSDQIKSTIQLLSREL